MKMLYLVRHSKAEDHAARLDFDRVLTAKGAQDSKTIGDILANKGITPAVILASPSVRTLATANIIAGCLGYPSEKISTDKKLYNAEDKTLLAVLRGVEGDPVSIMVVAHNPGITEFANGLLGTVIASMPTSAVIAGELRINQWSELRWNCGSQQFFEFPH